MDGVTATAAELNLIDGGTARGTTALADGDGILINDAGTMRMSTVQTVKTYMADGAGLSTLIAKEATVERLILGHYSTRYSSIEEFKTEAKQVFDNVELAEDGKKFII